MAAMSARTRYALFLGTTLVFLTLFVLRGQWYPDTLGRIHLGDKGSHQIPTEIPTDQEGPPKPGEPAKQEEPAKDPPPPPGPVYKPVKPQPFSPPIKETFPLAAAAKSPSDLPSIPSWNKPPSIHVPERTPLFIGFTRNWPLLQQVVVGYITAGWPPSDIYVIENTGTYDANAKGRLTLQNPFFLDHYRLKTIFEVNIITTPAYMSFAQLQNLYFSEALKNDWPYYFWSHMDVLPMSPEDEAPYKSLYMRCVDAIRESIDPQHWVKEGHKPGRWALRYFSYDWLTLMNTAAMEEMGGWDSMISYYGTDCDMYDRMRMAGLATSIAHAGRVFDMGQSIPDLAILYRKIPTTTQLESLKAMADSKGPAARRSYEGKIVEDARNSTVWWDLQHTLMAMEEDKVHGKDIRNAWQTRQNGGQGEPYYIPQAAFEEALEIQIHAGEAVYRAKWGQKRCDLINAGLKAGDEWRVEKGWEGDP